MDLSMFTGLEIMLKVKNGELPKPGITSVIEMEPTFVEKGKAIFKAKAKKEYTNPMGGIHGGFISTLIDSATGCAVHTMLEKGEVYGTIDLNVKMIRPIPIDVELFAEANVINRTKSLGFASCVVTDATGKVYGSGSATCMIK